MLAGIGGKTIAEAKERISYPEFLEWVAFRKKHGPLCMQLRVERLAAAQMFQFSRANSKSQSQTVDDFMLWSRKEDQEVSLEQAMEEWV